MERARRGTLCGVGCVTPVDLIGRDDAHNQQIVAVLRDANFYYFSGGNPEYVLESLRDSPAWAAIAANHQRGAVLAGCSAGAMMLGGYTLRVRAVVSGQPPQWLPGCGVVAALVVMPHFDRLASFVGQDTFRQIIAAAPASTTLIGVDEDTALVRAHSDAAWHVSGRQSVSVFDGDGARTIYAAGEVVPLD